MPVIVRRGSSSRRCPPPRLLGVSARSRSPRCLARHIAAVSANQPLSYNSHGARATCYSHMRCYAEVPLERVPRNGPVLSAVRRRIESRITHHTHHASSHPAPCHGSFPRSSTIKRIHAHASARSLTAAVPHIACKDTSSITTTCALVLYSTFSSLHPSFPAAHSHQRLVRLLWHVSKQPNHLRSFSDFNLCQDCCRTC